ncbi:MAG: 3-dehydroquinate synthase, partial [Anaerolineae bacterium]
EVTKSRLAALTAERQPVYDSVPLQVETTGRPPAVVAATVQRAATVAAALPRRAISVSTPRGGYGVVVGAGALDAIGALLAARDLARHVVVVADESVNALYGAQVARAASEAGARTARLEIRGGERSKSPATLADVYDALLAAGTERASTVLALGGGVVGDVAGFAAATFMRGVPLVQVPTTLLAMVDSSIGGKTGVNLPGGKNLVGAFKHPELVLADTRVLRSLPRSEIAAGLAEVVKAAVIGDPELLSTLERGAPGRDDAGSWAEIVSRAATVKARIVSQDPEEEGVRAVLNLGHTFGHALEIATGHRLAHGPAVAIGLVAASRLATRLGLAEPELGRRLERLLMILGLPVRYSGPSPEDVVAAMQTDKKRADGRLRFAVPTAVGQVTMVDAVPMTAVTAVVADLRAAMAPYD